MPGRAGQQRWRFRRRRPAAIRACREADLHGFAVGGRRMRHVTHRAAEEQRHGDVAALFARDDVLDDAALGVQRASRKAAREQCARGQRMQVSAAPQFHVVSVTRCSWARLAGRDRRHRRARIDVAGARAIAQFAHGVLGRAVLGVRVGLELRGVAAGAVGLVGRRAPGRGVRIGRVAAAAGERHPVIARVTAAHAVLERVRRPRRRRVALVAVEVVDRERHVRRRRARGAGAVVAALAVRDVGVVHLRRRPRQRRVARDRTQTGVGKWLVGLPAAVTPLWQLEHVPVTCA